MHGIIQHKRTMTRYSQEVADRCKEMYEAGMTMEMIGGAFGVSKRSAANWLKWGGVKSRNHQQRYKVIENEKTLSRMMEWTPEFSYIMGYTLADGCLDETNPNSMAMSYSCVTRDAALLEFIKGYLCVNSKIRDAKNGTMVRLRFHSNAIIERFKECGMMARKTWEDYGMPDIPDDAIPHFVRGQFDGNGCAALRSHGKIGGVVMFLGSNKIVTQIRNHLVRMTGCKECPVISRPGHFGIVWGHRNDIRKIRDFMYPSECPFFLSRKKEKIERIINGPC